MKKKKNKDRIKPWEGIGFTVGLLSFLALASEGSTYLLIPKGLICFAIIGIGALIYNLPKVVCFLAEKENALSSGHSDKAKVKNITKGILSESRKNVKCL